MSRAYSLPLVFLLAFAILLAIHLPYLRLPYFWDELGLFVPAALDLYRDGSWVSHTVSPGVHPPGVIALVASVWHTFGYSIVAARLTMLAVASLGVVFSFLLTRRLARGTSGVSPIVAVLFLIAAPIFNTQSMLVVLDLAAMTFTVLALLLFLDERYAWSALVCIILVMTRETAIATPAVFAAWLWFRERRRAPALYFISPAVALGVWLLILHRATGHWLGSDYFASYNITNTLDPVHIALMVVERARFLLWSDGHILGTIALVFGWRLLRGRAWAVTGLVAVMQVIIFTVVGGPLPRYLLSVLPILYAAVATAASVYTATWRWATHCAILALMIGGWFWNPPYPFAYENNLAMVDFIRLQQDAARYLEANAFGKRIATAWPLTAAITYPDLGYVVHPLQVVDAGGLRLSDLVALNRQSFDLLVVYKRIWPAEGTILDVSPLRDVLQHYYEYHPQATAAEIRAQMGFVPMIGWERGGQWLEIYGPATR